MTWNDVLALEPRLADLERQTHEVIITATRPFCANRTWRLLKRQLVLLVGYGRPYPGVKEPDYGHSTPMPAADWAAFGQHLDRLSAALAALPGEEQEHEKILHGSEAYDAVFQHLYSILPPCTHVGLCN